MAKIISTYMTGMQMRIIFSMKRVQSPPGGSVFPVVGMRLILIVTLQK